MGFSLSLFAGVYWSSAVLGKSRADAGASCGLSDVIAWKLVPPLVEYCQVPSPETPTRAMPPATPLLFEVVIWVVPVAPLINSVRLMVMACCCWRWCFPAKGVPS